MTNSQRGVLLALASCAVALAACSSDTFGVQPDAGLTDARLTEEAEASAPPTPTGKLLAAFQSRGEGNSDFTPFFSGDVAPPVAFDAEGNAYFAGSFSGTTSFGDPNKTTCTLSTKGAGTDVDAYVVRIDRRGNCAAAARIGGASTFDSVRALAVTPTGLVIAFGQLFKNTGPGQIGWSINGGADTLTTNGAFLVGLTTANLSHAFSQDMLPQSNATEPRGVAIGPGGTIAVSGSVPFLASYPFQNSGGVVSSNGNGSGYQGFVAEYQQNGQLSFARVWTVKNPNGSCISTGGGVGYAPNGDLFVTGRALGSSSCGFLANSGTVGSNPPPDWTTGPIASADGGLLPSTSYVVLRYDPKNAGALKGVYSRAFVGGSYARGAFVAPSGDVYALQRFVAPASFAFGSSVVSAGTGTLLLHFDGNLAEKSARLLPGTETSTVSVDGVGNVVVGGSNDANLDFGNGRTATFLGNADAFAAKFDASLANCLWLNRYATAANEVGLGLAIAGDGTIAIHGAFQGPSMPLDATVTLVNKEATGTFDGFGAFLAP